MVETLNIFLTSLASSRSNEPTNETFTIYILPIGDVRGDNFSIRDDDHLTDQRTAARWRLGRH